MLGVGKLYFGNWCWLLWKMEYFLDFILAEVLGFVLRFWT